MKKSVFLILVIINTGSFIRINGQTEQSAPAWPKSSSYVTLYGSSFFLIANPINIAYEHIWHPSWVHPGFSAGLTFVFMEGVSYAVCGGHATFSVFAGTKKHHMDLKIGFSYTPIRLYSEHGYYDFAPTFWPVVTLGYRFEKPDGKRNFRTGIGTGGLGFGAGWRVK